MSRVGPVEDRQGVKLSTYGRGKTGKTRLACSFPKPVLLIGTEDGTKSVLGVPGIDFVRIRSSEEVAELAVLLRDGGSSWKAKGDSFVRAEPGTGDPYLSGVLDTAGGLQDMIFREVKGLDDVPVQRTYGMADQRDWGLVGVQWKERMRSLLRLADEKGLNVVVIAHERNFNDGADTSDVMLPTVGSALTPSVAGWLNAECDYVCQCFIREEEVTTTRTVGEGKLKKEVTTSAKTGRKQYCLRVGPHPVYLTGFRLPPGFVLPDVIVDPSYEKILAVIRGEKADKIRP